MPTNKRGVYSVELRESALPTVPLEEAVTIKAQAKSALKQLQTMLKDKALPQRVRDAIGGAWDAMTKTWDDLAAELDGESPALELAPVAAKESELISEGVPLVEAAKGGVIPIKVISAGWGSSGYYSSSVLKRDGPNVFKAGLQMFVDHPTHSEDSARPERSLKDLAAVLMSDARWQDEGKQGPGLYAEAKLFTDHAERIREMAPHIGVSIRAMGNAKQGEAEGRKGNIIEAITSGRSVDFVTLAGAGGAILSESNKQPGPFDGITMPYVPGTTIKGTLSGATMSESRGAITQPALTEPQEVQNMMTEAEQKELSDVKAELARLREAALLREAAGLITATLAEAKTLPELTRTRLAKQLANSGVFKDGALDEAATKAFVESTVKDELDYINKLNPTGKIVGMGSGTATPIDESKASNETLYASFVAMGLSESAAKLAAGK